MIFNALAGDVIVDVGNTELQNQGEVYLNLKNTEASGRQYALVSGGSFGGIGAGKFSVYDKTEGASRLSIDNFGNVGIGTTSPTQKLDVAGQIHATGDICTDLAGGKCLSTGGGSGGSSPFWQASGQDIHNTNNGNVGIKTSTPGSDLEVNGQIKITSGIADKIVFAGTQSTPHTLYLDNSKGIRFWDGASSAELMRITNTGNVGIGTTNPGSKLSVAGKANIDSSAVASTIGLEIDHSSAVPNTDNIFWNAAESSLFLQNNNEAVGSGPKIIFRAGAGTGSMGGIAVLNTGTQGGRMILSTRVNGGLVTEKMRIDESGNVGIGTTGPATKLHISDPSATAGPALRISAAGAPANSKHWDIRNSAATAAWGDLDFTALNDDGTVKGTRLMLKNTGNVGIGTTAPVAKLDLGTSSGQVNLAFTEAGTGRGYMGLDGGGNLIVGSTDNDIAIRSESNLLFASGGGTERMRIASGGNVGIGTADPGKKLDVAGELRASSKVFFPGISNAAPEFQLTWSATGELIQSASSKRYKENIQDFKLNLANYFKLQPRSFNYKNQTTSTVGLIAEEVDQIIPELVIYDKDGLPDSVRYPLLPVYNLKAIQSQQAAIEALKARNAELEARLDVLESKLK